MKIKKIFNLFMIIGLAVLASNTSVYSQKKSKKIMYHLMKLCMNLLNTER
jgi:hypothetical protein